MVESAAIDIFESWHDFYMLKGSVASTLIGLIFVAVSFHLDAIVRLSEVGDVRSTANEIFTNFAYTLSFALIFMALGESLGSAGGILLVLGM